MTAVKVGVTGTHSTGKSTLLGEIERLLICRGRRVKRVKDLATHARRLGFPILREHTFESTLWIMTRGISLELSASLKADVVLVDRPAMDALAYLFAALVHRRVSLLPDQRAYLLDLARHHSRTYTAICKTVLNPSIPLGPGRDNDSAFRAAVETQLNVILTTLSIQADVVTGDGLFAESIVDKIESALNNRTRQ